MNKWFNETFHASLFERAGTCKTMWLTQKQTAICIDNMEKHVVRTLGFQGDSTKHLWFSCEWNGRNVRLNYSKLNKCGSIEFSFTEAELAVRKEEIKKGRERIENERIERIKRRPERLAKVIADIKKEIERFETELSYEDNEPDEVEFYTHELEEANAKLAKYTS